MPLIAQQEDHIVRRGHYKPAVTDTLKSEPIVKAPSRWYNIITANFAFEEYYPLGVGYMRLKQTGSFYFGPGMHARLAWDVAMSAGVDAFIHGRLEAPSGFMGFKRTHPYFGLSAGGQFTGNFALYFDYSTGFSFDYGEHTSIGISYYGVFFNGVKHNMSNEVPRPDLCHGVELSFRF